MASTMALGPCTTAILALLRASVSLTTYVGTRVYPDDRGDATDRTSKPYVQVEGGREVPSNTMGAGVNALKWGSEVRIPIRVVTDAPLPTQGHSISSIIKQALDGQTLTVSGYPFTTLEFEDLQTLKTEKAGCAPVREFVNNYLVTVHQ